MNKLNLKRSIVVAILSMVITLTPSIGAFAQDTKADDSSKFSVEIKTDKDSYTKDEEIKYSINVKNISGTLATDVKVTNEGSEKLKIKGTSGTVDGNNVVWSLKELKADADESFTLTSIKTDAEIESPNNGNGAIPYTGGRNPLVILGIGLGLMFIGVIIYKKKGVKVTTTVVLLGVFTTSLINFSIIPAKASDLRVKEYFTHTVNVDGELIKNVVIVEATLAEDLTPTLKLVNDNGQMEFEVGNVNSNCRYTLSIEKNKSDSIKSIAIDPSKKVIADLEESYGIYKYQVIATSKVGEVKKSNVVTYTVTSLGSGVIGEDQDGDGLDNDTELKLGTDPTKEDTDGDGLPDGYEYYILETNPKLVDTDGNKINDGDEDFDFDTLNNLKEFKIGTNPVSDDSDNDGLKDNDEIDKYKTSPILKDTDEDTLTDNDEIVLKFNPLKKDSDDNGILDCDEKVKQKLGSDNISEELLVGNSAIPSLTLVTNGNANNNLIIREYTDAVFGDSHSVIGKPIEIRGGDFESGDLSFAINKEIKPLVVGTDGREFSKIIICYTDEDGETDYLPVEYNSETNSITTNIKSSGKYFALDIETMYAELGMTLPVVKKDKVAVAASYSLDNAQEFTAEQLKDMDNQKPSTNASESLDASVLSNEEETAPELIRGMSRTLTEKAAKGQADIVILMDTTGSMGDKIASVQNNINSFVDSLKGRGIAPNLALVDFRDITCDGINSTRVHKNGSSNWFTNTADYKKAISNLRADGGGDEPECDLDALETGRLLDLRASAGKFFILVTDAHYKENNRYGIPSMGYEIELLKNSGIKTFVVAPNALEPTYNDLYKQTDGAFVNINGNFSNELMKIADKIGEEVVDKGTWVYLNGSIPVPAKLKELPTKGSKVDTDEDTIYDVDELKDINPVKEVNLDAIVTKISKGIITGTKFGVVKMYNYKSNPAVGDTDKDGYPDAEDLKPKVKFITPTVLLHGRGDNTAGCFGVETDLYDSKNDKTFNNNYNTSTSSGSMSGGALDYTDYSTQEIKKVTKGTTDKKNPAKLGFTMEEKGYTKNENLFVFNYPNRDMTKANATKFQNYLTNLAATKAANGETDFYPTKKAKADKEIYVDLVGHSNGGLVSRYYIENLGGSKNVKKLVTIDTPHFGSGLADIADNVLEVAYPMDIDLNPVRAIFGGSYKTYTSINPIIREKVAYINSNQTDPLNYKNHGDTKYYFMDGYDAVASIDLPIGYLNQNIPFDLSIGEINTFGEYKNSIKNSFVAKSKYPELATDVFGKNLFNLKTSDGDNVVNNQSQLGMKFTNDKDGSELTNRIATNGMWMNIDTYMGHSAASHFHGQNQHRIETINKAISYLKS